MLLVAGFACWAATAVPAADEAGAGSLEVEDAWARATAATQTTGAVYLTVRNHAAEPDRLMRASTPVARSVELHTHTVDAEGIARMRQVDAVAVPPQGSTTFAPGGMHIMLVGLDRPLTAGEPFPLTLSFDANGEIEVEVEVVATRGAPPAAGSGQGGSHGTH